MRYFYTLFLLYACCSYQAHAMENKPFQELTPLKKIHSADSFFDGPNCATRKITFLKLVLEDIRSKLDYETSATQKDTSEKEIALIEARIKSLENALAQQKSAAVFLISPHWQGEVVEYNEASSKLKAFERHCETYGCNK